MSGFNSPVNVAVLGAGSWGTALASLASKHCPTLIWARNPQVAHDINNNHTNSSYLNGISLPNSLRATASFQTAINHVTSTNAEGLVILGVPVAALEQTCTNLVHALVNKNHTRLSVIWTCKGLQQNTNHLPHTVVQNVFTSLQGVGLGVLSGPSFAQEVAQNLPVALTLGTTSPATLKRTITALHGDTARIYSSEDITGIETGAALKNVIAIACGISDGLELGNNARAALITRGLVEIQRLGLALGGRPETFFGLTGLGDLVLTTTGAMSRNRQVGMAIGKGQNLNAILATGITAEGARCARAVIELANHYKLDLPICNAVYRVLFEGLAPIDAVNQLIARQAGPE